MTRKDIFVYLDHRSDTAPRPLGVAFLFSPTKFELKISFHDSVFAIGHAPSKPILLSVSGFSTESCVIPDFRHRS